MMARVRKFSKRYLWIVFIFLIGLACQFPGAVAQQVAPKGQDTPATVLAGRPTSGAIATVVGGTTTPGRAQATLTPTAPSGYPGDGSGIPASSPETGDLSSATLTASPEAQDPYPIGSLPVTTPEAPLPTSTEADAAAQPAPGDQPYPGAELQATAPVAPAATNPLPPLPVDRTATPPLQLAQSTGPAIGSPPPNAPSPGAPPPGGSGPPPRRTPNGATAVFATSQPTEPFVTATSLPSPTRYIPPSPQASVTPTPTRTLLPAPPWVRVPLQASDPRKVKLASGKVQLVEFFAYWSGPSQAMAPLVRGLEEAYASEVNFVYLDIDDPAVATFERELRFQLEPHFFLLDAQGHVLRQWQGYVTTEALQSAIEDALLR